MSKLDYGGKHRISVPKGEAIDGVVVKANSLDVTMPKVNEEIPVDPMFDCPNPLAGKSGKDSLSEEEAVLS